MYFNIFMISISPIFYVDQFQWKEWEALLAAEEKWEKDT